MGIFAPKQSATDKHFGIVPMAELLRLRREYANNALGYQPEDPAGIPEIRNSLQQILFEVANRLPPGERINMDSDFWPLERRQIDMLTLLGALERVQREGVSGPGRSEPFGYFDEEFAVGTLAQKGDIAMLKNGLETPNPQVVEAYMKARIDKALGVLARRVSKKGKDPKNAKDWTCFTEPDRTNLVAQIALQDALDKGEEARQRQAQGFIGRNWGKGVVATTVAAGLAGGFAVTHNFPEETDAVRAAFNAEVEPEIRKVSPEAADLYERYNLIPTEPQAERWLRANLPQLADLIVGAPEEAPQE